ncbi:short chain dehydrogenase domain-containing protein [Sarocladium implicatum]|nr:short chain dehydrogenase domain-containing protein [Sarocladium implicatum]
MPTYVISGASKGIGLEFVRQLLQNPENTVIGLVRNVENTKKTLGTEFDHPQFHLVRGDLDDAKSLIAAASETSKITGGKLDYLIANAGIGKDNQHLNIDEFDPDFLEKEFTKNFRTNAVGNAHLINAFLPLILAGDTKKVFVLSSAMGDRDFVKDLGVWVAVPYAVSKAALNMIVAKYDATYRKKGVLFMAISPGLVDTGEPLPEEFMVAMQALGGRLAEYAPDFKGPITPTESVSLTLPLMEKVTIEGGHAGDMISHWGNKQWV